MSRSSTSTPAELAEAARQGHTYLSGIDGNFHDENVCAACAALAELEHLAALAVSPPPSSSVVTGSPAEHAAQIRQALTRGDLDDRRLSGRSYSDVVLQKNLAALAVLERQAEEAERVRPGKRHERGYIQRTIETVRVHKDADNCWPQWANTFADEIEDSHAEESRLTGRVQQLEDALRPLVEAVDQWLAESGPGMHINTAKGRGMTRRAVESARAVLVVPSPPDSKEGT